MHPISRPVPRKDHSDKAAGSAVYAADRPLDGVLTARLVRSQRANAAFASIRYPPLPEGYFLAQGSDLPINEASLHALDKPVFAADRARYVGEAVAAIAGPNPAVVDELVNAVQIEYQQEGPIITHLDKATETFFDFPLTKGDAARAFEKAECIFEEVFRTGLQEQAYLEPQTLEACVHKGVLTVRGSMQCPYYIKTALRHAFSLEEGRVRVLQDATGGGFGGKEEYPSLLACQVAAVAVKSGKPCRLTLKRREDMAVTTKRHPSRITLRAAVSGGRVTALEADIVLDGGAYRGLSDVVLQRALFCCTGVYNIEHLRARGRVVMTHTPSNGAFRGFGGPQSFFAIETFMAHIARALGVEPMAFKAAHLARKGDQTATSGVYHEQVPLPAMLERACLMSGYATKRAAFASQAGNLRRGIGASLVFHGCGFTGNGERDVIRAAVRLEKDEEGMVKIMASNAEIGQGLRTTFPKVVAETLGIPLSQVQYDLPDTAVSPDSGPTVASRSMMVVGRLLQCAATELREKWRDGEAQMAEASYVDPPHRQAFDMSTFQGDAYPAYAWAVNIVEVQVDVRTMQPRVTDAYAIFDCGTPMDLNVLRGQAEGGIAQGLGYAAMERMDVGPDGAIRQNSFTDYALPTALDTPAYHVEFYDDPYSEGPFGARGAGELTLVGAAPACVAAIEHALGISAHQLPLTPEALFEAEASCGQEG